MTCTRESGLSPAGFGPLSSGIRASRRAARETPARVGPLAGLRAGFGPLARGFRPVAGLHARVGPVAGLRAGFGPVAGLQPVRRGQ